MSNRPRHDSDPGGAIRGYRDAIGWSTTHAARAAGIGRNTWRRLEENPSSATRETRRRASGALGLPLDTIDQIITAYDAADSPAAHAVGQLWASLPADSRAAALECITDHIGDAWLPPH